MFSKVTSALNPTENIFRLTTKNPDAVVCILDESVEMKGDLRCDLLSAISPTEFSLALLDKKQNKFLGLEVFQHDKFSDTVKQAEWINEVTGKSLLLKNRAFKTTAVAVVNELTTLVPTALFREEDAEKYFRFNFRQEGVRIHSENIRSFDVVNAFAVSAGLGETVNHLFDKPVIHHHATALLEGVHLSFKKSNDKIVLINIRQGHADVVVTEGKKLVFINSFSFANADDLAYYVLFVCDRLQLNPETVPAYITGEVEKGSAWYHILYKYIRNIGFAPRPDVFDFSYVFEEIPSHFYFNLFSLALCES